MNVNDCDKCKCADCTLYDACPNKIYRIQAKCPIAKCDYYTKDDLRKEIVE